MGIAYLGDEYSNSYLAARTFGGSDLLPYATVTAALEAVADGTCAAAAVPIENSVEGSVGETLDALSSLPLYIRAETVLPIAHRLIAAQGAGLEDIETVYSHPQALSQCRKYLERMGLTGVAVSSTSEGTKRVGGSAAAIARCARPGQIVLADHIEDYPTNATRFVLVGDAPSFTGGKVSLIFETINAPGALLKALSVLAEFGLNMVRIESRPHKSAMGRYVFFVDLQFDEDKQMLMRVLTVLSEQTGSLKFIGRYDTVTEAK